jgi:hypothetical protein
MSRKKCDIKIGLPEKDPKSIADYRCPIATSIFPITKYAYGIDSIQALMMATELLRVNFHSLAKQGFKFYVSKSGPSEINLQKIWTIKKSINKR